MTGQATYALAEKTALTEYAKKLFLNDNRDEIEQVRREMADSDKPFSTDLYIERNRNKLDEYVSRINDSLTMNPKVAKFASEAGSVIQAFKYMNVRPPISSEKIDAYKTYFAPIAADILGAINAKPNAPVQTTSQFMQSVLDANEQVSFAFNKEYGVHNTVFEQQKALNNIYAQGGKFVEFDLEGIGEHIHEFSFADFDPAIKNAAHANTKTMVNGLIGMNKAQYAEAKSLIDELAKGGIYEIDMKYNRGVKSTDMYKIMNLAKFGDDRTTWERAADGTFRLTNFVNDKDIAPNDIISKARRGLERYRQLWEEQTKELVDFNGFNVYAHEKSMLAKVLQMKQSGITMVTQNGFGYDIGQINRFFTGSQASKGAYDAWRSITGSGDILSVVNHFDVAASLREGNRLGWTFDDSAADVAKEKAAWNSSTALMIRFGGGTENVANVVKSSMGGMYVQHSAASDTIAQGFEFQKMMESVFNPKHEEYALNPRNGITEHFAKAGDIFYVNKGLFSSNGYGNLSFTYDTLTKDFRFAGGVKVSAAGKAGEDIVSQGLKKGSLAMLVGMKKISLADLPQNVVDAIGVDAGQRELIATYFMPYGGNAGAAHSNNLQVHISTESETRDFLGRMMYAGNMDVSYKFRKKFRTKYGADTKYVDETASWDNMRWLQKAASGRHNELVDTKDVDFYTKKALSVDGEFSFEALASRNEKVLARDTAANWIRTMNYDKWEKAEKYLKLVKDEADHLRKEAKVADGHEPLNTALMRKGAEALNKKAATDDKLLKKLQSIVETELWNGEKLFMSNSADNMLKSAGYLYDMRELYRFVAKAANSFSNNPRERNLYFSALMDNMMSSIAMKTIDPITGRPYDIYGASGRNKLGIKEGKVYDNTLPQLGLEKDVFRVDIEAMLKRDNISAYGTVNSQMSKYLDIDVYSNSPHWSKNLLRMLNQDEKQEVSALRWLARNLNRQYADAGLKIKEPEIYNADTMMASITEGLRGLRRSFPEAGAVPRVSVPDLTRMPDVMVEFFATHTQEERQGFYESVLKNSPVAEFAAGKNFEYDTLSRELTETYYAATKDVNVDAVKAYGYTESAAKLMLDNRERRWRDTEHLLNSVFKMAIKDNPYLSLAFNKNTGAISVNAGEGYSLDITKYMVFDRFDKESGTFTSQLGGRRMSTRTGFIQDTESGDFEIHSWIRQFENELLPRLGFAKHKNIGPREILSRMNWAFSEAADKVSKMAITRYDAQDRRAGFAYSLKGYFSSLGYLHYNHAFDEYNFSDKLLDVLDELAGKAQGDNVAIEPNYNQLRVLYSNFDEIMDPLGVQGSKVSDLFFGNNIADAKYYRENIHGKISALSLKHPEQMLAHVADDDLASPLAGISEDNRTLENFRTIEFDYNERAKNVENARSIMRPSSILMNNLEAVKYDGLDRGRTIDSRMRVRKASLNSGLLAEILDEYIRNNPNEAKNLKHLGQMFSMLNESGGMMDPILLEMLPKSIVQKESTDNLATMEELNMLLSREQAETALKVRRATNELISFVNGSVDFAYGGEAFVKHGEVFEWEKTYVGNIDKIKADSDSFVTRRLIDRQSGQVVAQEKIRQILNREENIRLLADYAGDAGLLRAKAGGILAREGLVEKYILETHDPLGFRKLMDYDEKQGTRAIMAYLGEVDEDIRNVIGTGKKELYLSMDTIRNRGRLNTVLKAYGYNEVSENQHKWFVGKAQAEQREYFNLVRKALGAKTGEEVGDILLAGNTFSEAVKGSHMEIQNIIEAKLATALDYMVRSKDGFADFSKVSPGELEKAFHEQREILYGKLVNEKIFTDKDGNSVIRQAGNDSFALGKFTKINTQKLEEILDGYLQDGKNNLLHSYSFGETGKEVVFAPAQIAGIWDADMPGYNRGGNKKGVYATRRMTTNLGQELYGKTPLEKTWEAYTKSASSLAEAAQQFNETYQGVANVLLDESGSYKLQLAEGVDGTKINSALIRNIKEEVYGGDVRGNLVKTDADIKRMSQKTGISEDRIRGIRDAVRNLGYGEDFNVGAEFIMHQHAFEMTRAARIINKEIAGSLSLEEQKAIAMKNSGDFDMVELKDIAHQAQMLNEGNPNRVNRSMMVNLGDTVGRLSGTQYVALPYQSYSVMANRNDEGAEMFTKLMNLANGLDNKVLRYEAASEKERALGKLASGISGSVKEILSTVGLMEISKYGEMAEGTGGYLYGSGMFKAGIINEGNGVNPILERAHYEGLTIAEHMKAGRKVNAAFVGLDFFENAMGGSDMESVLAAISKKSGQEVTVDGLMGSFLDKAEKFGVKGITLRQPLEYTNSVVSTQIYLDRSLASNHMLATNGIAVGYHSDMDGDIAYSHLVRSQAKIYKDGELISDVRLNELQINQLKSHLNGLEGNYTIEYDEGIFKELKRSNDLLANSAFENMNQKFEEDVTKALKEKYYAKGMAIGGNHYAFKNMDPKERLAIKDRFDTIAASEEFGQYLGGARLEDMSAADLSKAANSYVETIAEGAEREAASEALAYGVMKKSFEHEISTKFAKKDAGLVNMSTYRFKQILDTLEAQGKSNVTSEDAEILGRVMEHLNEAGQAPKNAAQTWTPQDLITAMDEFFGVRGGRRNPGKLFDIMEQEYEAMKGKEFKNLPDNASVHDIARVKEALLHVMPEGKRISPKAYDTLRLGYTKSMFESNNLIQNADDMGREMQQIAQSKFEEMGLTDAYFRDMDILIDEGTANFHTGEKLLEPDDMDRIAPTLSENISSAMKGVRNVLHGRGALAMLGFAGMTMMAGVMGGAPTAPPSAQGQAKGIQSEDAMYEIPSTMTSPNDPGAKQSYIININASTSRGRDFAETAIKQAFASVPNNNQGINMTMNIKDSSSNIGYSDIASQVAEML